MHPLGGRCSALCVASVGPAHYAMCGRAMGPDFLFTWPDSRVQVGQPDAWVLDAHMTVRLSLSLSLRRCARAPPLTAPPRCTTRRDCGTTG